MHPRATELISLLELSPHPEGGYFREIFRSAAPVLPADGRGTRSAVTTIFFLLVEGQFSRWHGVASDEVWHLYEGDPLELLIAPRDPVEVTRVRLATAAASGERPSHTVPAFCWQAARPLGRYALAGCTVGPGFAYEDFRFLADDPAALEKLRSAAPDLASLA